VLNAGCVGATQPITGWKRDSHKKNTAKEHTF